MHYLDVEVGKQYITGDSYGYDLIECLTKIEQIGKKISDLTQEAKEYRDKLLPILPKIPSSETRTSDGVIKIYRVIFNGKIYKMVSSDKDVTVTIEPSIVIG